MSTIINPSVAARAVAAMRTQRCVITGHWNSNGLKDGYGHIEAIQKSLIANGIKLFCAGPFIMDSTSPTTGASAGTGARRSGSSMVGYGEAIPTNTNNGTNGGFLAAANIADHESLLPNLARFYKMGRGQDSGTQYNNIMRPLYFKPTYPVANTANYNRCGLEFQADPVNPFYFDRNKALRTDFWYGETPEGGTFRPAGVTNPTPNALTYSDSVVTVGVNADPSVMLVHTFDIPAATRDTKLRIGPAGVTNLPSGAGTSIFFGYQLTWEQETLAGVHVSPFYPLGSNSVHDYAYAMSRTDAPGTPDDTLDHWIQVHARPAVDAGQDPFFVWFIADGSNEASESLASVFKGETATTPEAYIDDVRYIISRVTAAWVRRGYKLENLVFALDADHPNLTAAEAKQIIFRTTGYQALAAAFPHTLFAFKNDEIWSTAELTAGAGGGSTNSYYASSGIDSIHMAVVGVGGSVVNGYQPYWARMMAHWLGAPAEVQGGYKRLPR